MFNIAKVCIYNENFLLHSYDSSDTTTEKLFKYASSSHKKSKKEKKHKKTSKSEKSHRKHKKSKKRHHKHSESSVSEDTGDKRRSGALNEKFTEIMHRVTKDVNPRPDQQANGGRFSITRTNLQTDPGSLVEEITKTIQNNIYPTMEVASSGSESEMYV